MKIKSFVMLTLGVFVLTAVFGSTVTVAEDAEYVSNKKCKVCHNKKSEGAIWSTWKEMNHAKAYDTLLSEEAKAAAAKKGLDKAPNEAPECLKCHVTAYDAAAAAAPDAIALEDGVQCESCHGPASLHLDDGKAKKLKKDDSVDISAHIIRPKAEDCLKCHNDESPTWNPERYTLDDGSKVGFDFKQAWAKIKHSLSK